MRQLSILVLCLVTFAAAQKFTTSGAANLTLGGSFTLVVSLDVLTYGPTTLSISVYPPGVVTTPSSQLYLSAGNGYFSFSAVAIGAVTLTLSADNNNYGIPSPVPVLVINNVYFSYPGQLYPGTVGSGTVSLDASPYSSLVVSFSGSSNVIFTPGSLTFKHGDHASQPFTVQSKEPGTYAIALSLSGSDYANNLVSSPPSGNILIESRNILSGSSSVGTVYAGDSTGPILVYLDVAPDNSLTLQISPNSSNVAATPSSLTFTPGSLSASFKLQSISILDTAIIYNLAGPDASNYVVDGLPSSVNFQARPVITPTTLPSTSLGVPTEFTVYLKKAPPSQLIVQPNATGLVFSPASYAFGPSTTAVTFSFVPSVSASTIVTYQLTGTDSALYGTPSASSFTLSAGMRTVSISCANGFSGIAIGVLDQCTISVDYATPNSFSVSLSGSNLVFSPSTFTFTSSVGTLKQTFFLTATAAGGNFIYFQVTGTDAALVSAVSSVQVTASVVGNVVTSSYATLYPGVTTPNAVGVQVNFNIDTEASLSFSNLVGSPSLAVQPSTVTSTINYRSFALTVTPSSAGYTILTTSVSGPDAVNFAPVTSLVLTVNPIPFNSLPSGSTLVVGVPLTGFVLSVSQISTIPVTVTPSSAFLQFIPSTFSFSSTVSEVCFSVVPLVVTTEAPVVTFTISDTVNYVVPSPWTVSNSIAQRFFNLPNEFNSAIILPIGIPSQNYRVSLSYPTSTGVTLTPSAEGCTFTPASLNFNALTSSETFSITTNMLLSNAIISWAVTGPDAANYTAPSYFTQLSSTIRTVTITYNPYNTFVNVSAQYQVSLNYAPTTSITVTPYGPGLVFSPPSVTFAPLQTLSYIAVNLPTWEPSFGSSVGFEIFHNVTGPDAAWYQVQPSNTFTFYLRTISTSFPNSIPYGGISTVNTLSLAYPAEKSVIVTPCGPSDLVFTPSSLTFGGGVSSQQFTVSANSQTGVYLTSAIVNFALSGASAEFYAQPSAVSVSLTSSYQIATSNIYNFYAGQTFVTEFFIYDPKPSFSSVTLTPAATGLTFSPSSITFTPNNLRYFVSVAANKVLEFSYGEEVTFSLSGPSANLFATPASYGVSINLGSIYSSSIGGQSYFYTNYDPVLPFTLTVINPASVAISPSTFTFTPSDNMLFYSEIPSSYVSATEYFWFELSGPGAAYFYTPTPYSYSNSQGSISITASSGTISPETANCVQIFVTLSVSPPNGLSITPLFSNGLAVSPSELNFAPGTTQLYFTVQSTVAVSASSSYFSIEYAVSGPDAYWFAPVTTVSTVTVSPGSVSTPSGYSVTLGIEKDGNEIALSFPPPNGVTYTPISSLVVFNPPSFVFTPGVSLVRFSFVFVGATANAATVYLNASGPDVYLYNNPPSITIYNSLRYFDIPLPSNVQIGVPSYFVVSTDAPPNGITVTPFAPGAIFTPSVFDFASGQQSIQVSVVISSPITQVSVSYQLSGPDVSWYRVPQTAGISVTFRKINFSSTYLYILSGANSTYQTVTPSVPGNFVLTPTAAGCTFYPSQFTFTPSIASTVYTVECLTAASVSNTQFTTTFSISGTDANLYSPPSCVTIVLSPLVINVPSSLSGYVGLPTQSSIYYSGASPVPFTVTPYALGAVFQPSSFSFGPTQSFSYFTVTSNSAPASDHPIVVSYNITGISPGSYVFSPLNTRILPALRNFFHPLNGANYVYSGANSGPLAIRVDIPPNTDVSIAIAAPGCTFTPASLSFTPTVYTGTFSYECQALSSISQNIGVVFTVSGTDAALYAQPSGGVVIQPRIFNLDSFSAQVIHLNYTHTVSIPVPPYNGVTLTPSAPGVSFSPSSLVFNPWTTSVSYYVYGNSVGIYVPISWSVSGPDASYFIPPPIVSLTINPKIVNLPTFNNGNNAIFSGTPTSIYNVELNYPVLSSLTVVPTGAGVVFTPSTLVFTPGVAGIKFQIRPTLTGTFPLNYYLSGPDANDYVLSTTTPSIITSLIALSIPSIIQPTVGVASQPYVFYAQNTPSDVVTVTFFGSGLVFTPPSVTLGPTAQSGTFRFTSSQLGPTQISFQISGNAATDFSSNVYSSGVFTVIPKIFYVPNLPDLYAGVTSSSISVGVNFPPSSLSSVVTLTPSAADTVFDPPTLTFTQSTVHVEFNMTSSSYENLNNGPTSQISSHVIHWVVGGTEAGWYAQPSDYNFYPLPRDLTVYSQIVTTNYVFVPIVISIGTSYSPATNLTITPSGGFTFSPEVVTISPGVTSALLTIIPQMAGTLTVWFSVGGPDAQYYLPTLAPLTLSVNNLFFTLPSWNNYLNYGFLAEPQRVRTNYIPPNGVTLTLSCPYIDFFPSTLVFTPETPYADFRFSINNYHHYLSATFTISYVVGGQDATLFSKPGNTNIVLGFNAPLRSIAITNFPSTLIPGVWSPPVEVAIANVPIGELVLTPFADSNYDILFNPPTFTLTKALNVTTFSIYSRRVIPQAVYVQFAFSGPDAIFYQQTSIYSLNVVPRTFVTPSFGGYLVGIPSSPLTVSLQHLTPNDVWLSFYGTNLVFSPSTLYFTNTTNSISFTVTGTTVSSSVYVYISIGGTDSDLYTLPATTSTYIYTRSWNTYPGGFNVDPGSPYQMFYAVQDSPTNYLTLTPFGPNLIFTPPSVNISSNSSSALFTAVGQVGQTYSTVSVHISGPDALWYNTIPDISVYIVSETIDEIAWVYDIDFGIWETAFIYLTIPAINGLYITPNGAGLIIDPQQVYFPPGVQVAHFAYTSYTPGQTQVTYSVSGPDSLIFNSATGYTNQLNVHLLDLEIGWDFDLIVGSMSEFAYIYSFGDYNGNYAAPPAPVNISFVVSPESAVSFFPPVLTLEAPFYSAEFQFLVNTPNQNYYFAQPILSGPGASYFYHPSYLTIEAGLRDFILEDIENYQDDPSNGQFYVGVPAGPFGVSARSVPTEVTLTLSGEGLQFIPSVLRFTGTYETLYFSIVPLYPTATYISFSVGGVDAALFNTPGVYGDYRILHNFVLPQLPAVIVGQTSPVLTVSVASTIVRPVVLTPEGDCVVFTPPYLLFTPNVSVNEFTYVGTCVNGILGDAYNPVVPGKDEPGEFGFDGNSEVDWLVREMDEDAQYYLSQPINTASWAINVLPAAISVSFSQLKIGNTGSLTVTVSSSPRSDLTVSFVGNNLNFDPPTIVFLWNSTTSFQVAVTPVHADYKDSDSIPFVVDYIVGGTNYYEFIPPSQTLLGVQRGAAPLVGSLIGANSANAVSFNGSYLAILFALALALCM